MRKKRKWLVPVCLLLTAALAAGGVIGWRVLQEIRRGPALDILPLFQGDYEKAVSVGGRTKTVGSSGCGVVCLSMALSFLGADSEQTPQTLFEEAVLYGDYTGQDGFSQPALSRVALRHGAEGEWVDADEETLRGALAAGRPVICHMGKGAFTAAGHYILLRALAPDGSARVNDPASPENTDTVFPIGQILEETKGDAPFLLLRLAGTEEE